MNPIYTKMLKLMRHRAAYLLECEPADLPDTMSLGQIINLIFLIRGEVGAIGSYWPTLEACLQLFGQHVLWAKPLELAAEDATKENGEFIQ